MHNQEVLDHNLSHKKYKELLLALRWWEKNRLIFNIVVGIIGVGGLLLSGVGVYMADFVGIVFWALFCNLCYSVGFLLEAFDVYYFKSNLKLYRFRLLFFMLGLLSVSFITLIGALFFRIIV